MKKLLFLIFLLPYFGISQNYIPTKDVYDFDVGDEFHYEQTLGYGYSKKTIKKILSKTTTTDSVSYQVHEYGVEDISGSPQTRFGRVKTEKYYISDTIYDTIPPCIDTFHPYYLSWMYPSINCSLIDTIFNEINYGITYRLNNSDFEYQKYFYYSNLLGKTYFYEWIGNTFPPTRHIIKLTYYKKDSLGLTWGTPWTFTTSLNEISSINFSVYPNPSSSSINIIFNESITKLNYELINSLGQVIKNKRLKSNSIDISSIPAGIYFLKITNENGDSGMKRIVISR